MWHITDQTVGTSFVAELSKCGKHAQYIIVHEGRYFLRQKQVHIFHVSLILHVGTQYYTLGYQYFGHVSVIRCLPDEDVYRILSRGNFVFRSFC